MDTVVDKEPRREEILPDEKLIDALDDIEIRLAALLERDSDAMRVLDKWRGKDQPVLVEEERQGLTYSFRTTVDGEVWEDVFSYTPRREDLSSETAGLSVNPAQFSFRSHPLERPLEEKGTYLGDNWENPSIEHRVVGRPPAINTAKAVDGARAQLGDIERRLNQD